MKKIDKNFKTYLKIIKDYTTNNIIKVVSELLTKQTNNQ